jgi:branched-chain amino acid transport system permease protein
VIVVAAGGAGTLAGPVVGAFAVTFGLGLDVFQTHLRDKLGLVFGGLALVVVALAPSGLVGAARDLWNRRRPPRETTSAAPSGAAPAESGPVAAPSGRPSDGPLPTSLSAAGPAPAPASPLAARTRPMGAGATGRTAGAAPGAPVLLSVRGLRRTFGGVTALDGLDLDVVAGTVHAVIGPNGSGKSTFVNLVSGAERPTGGRLVLAGRDITDLPAHRRAALGVARTFQGVHVWPRMGVLENVLAGAHVRGTAGLGRCLLGLAGAEERRLRATAGELLDLVGLGPKAGERAGGLTLAEQRRLELARALAAGPTLLLLDEPASGMDGGEIDGLVNLLARLTGDGLTVVLVEHHVDAVVALADTVTVVDQGVKVAEGPPTVVVHDHAVREVYLGPVTGRW